MIGFGRSVGFVRFLEPSGGMSDPHKTGETVSGGEEKGTVIIIVGIMAPSYSPSSFD
jgi:hypothetical protein